MSSPVKIYIIQSQTNNNTDLSTRDPWRYAPIIIGVYADLKKAQEKASSYAHKIVEDINIDRLEDDAEPDDLALFTQTDNIIEIFDTTNDFKNKKSNRDAVSKLITIIEQEIK